jgi:hypothetical protein
MTTNSQQGIDSVPRMVSTKSAAPRHYTNVKEFPKIKRAFITASVGLAMFCNSQLARTR